jgi:parallel beta-helix repeat protein
MKPVKLFLALAIFVFLAVSICSAADNEITLNYNFKQPVVDEVTIDNTVYNTVTMSDLLSSSKAATPSLPIKGAKVYIPDGKKFVSASVAWSNPQEIKLTHLIVPAQKQYPLSQTQNLLPTSPDQAIYSTDALYPATDVKLVSRQGMCGYRIAILNLYPVRYNPVQNTIISYTSAQLIVTLADSTEKSTSYAPKRTDQADLDRVLNFVDNKEDVPKTLPAEQKGPPQPPLGITGPFDYVIITDHALYDTPGPNNLQALRNYRINHNGMTAIVVTTDAREGNSGIYNWYNAGSEGVPPNGVPDHQFSIRQFIKDAYLRWGTKYVLLAGDADPIDQDPQAAIVPVRQLYDPTGGDPYYDNGLASDLFYACLDGTFDNDADGYYGENHDGEDGWDVDLIAEVYVGRAPADTSTEISNFVRKTLDYEARKTARDPYLFNTQQAGEALGAIGYPEVYQIWKRNLSTYECNEVKQGSGKWSYYTNGFEDRLDNNSTLYDFEWVDQNYNRQCDCWDKTDIMGIINNNVHLINADGHGDVDVIMKMSNSDADSLTNTKYFIGTSPACYSGSFDNRDFMDPENGCNCTLPYDSVVEHLVMGEHGAVAFVANSRYGWGDGWSTNGPSQFFSRNFWGAIFGKQISGLGKANQYSKEEAIPFMGGDYIRWCALDLNLFGDPALEVFLPTRLVPHPYTTIQAAISAAQAGETVVVAPGTYVMTKAFDIDINKEIKLKSASGPTSTIIDCNGYNGCVRFSSVNNASLEGFTIKNNAGGTNSAVVLVGSNATVKNNIFTNCPSAISMQGCTSPTIINNTVIGAYSGVSLLWSDSGPNTVGGAIKNNILNGGKFTYGTGVFKDNSVSFTGLLDFNNVHWFMPGAIAEGAYSFGLNPGSGSISEEPNFVSTAGDYHLDSWRSVCVDAGDSSTFYDKEPMPNGLKINMGAYGNTFGGEATLNHKPVLNPVGNKSVNFNNNLQFTVSATDPDGDAIVEFIYYPMLTGMSFNTTTGVFSWTPEYSQVGAYNMTFRAYDEYGMLSDRQTMTIYVTDPTPRPSRTCTYWEWKKGLCRQESAQ